MEVNLREFHQSHKQILSIENFQIVLLFVELEENMDFVKKWIYFSKFLKAGNEKFKLKLTEQEINSKQRTLQ